MRLAIRTAVGFLACAALGACGSSGQKGATSPLASAAPAGAEPSPSAAPSEAGVAAPPPAPPSDFFVVGDTDAELTLSPLGERAILSDARHLFLLDGDEVKADPALMAGVDRGENDWAIGRIVRAFGTFPDAAYLSVIRASGRTGLTELWHWEKDKWKLVREKEGSEIGAVVSAKGRTFALVQHLLFADGSFELVAGPRGVLPRLPRSKDGGAGGGCASSMRVTGAIGLPSGTVVAVGARCDLEETSKEPQLAVARWGSAQRDAKLEPLPGVAFNEAVTTTDATPLAAVGENEVWLAATLQREEAKRQTSRPYLARFDGASWHDETKALPLAIGALVAGPDGTLWATAEGRLFRRPPGGAFAPVVMPRFPTSAGDAREIEVREVWARSANDVWALGVVTDARAKGADGNGATRTVVLHTHAPTAQAVFPSAQKLDDALSLRRKPKPLDASCATPFVLLFSPTKVAPADFDYPLTRKALKGHSEFADAEFIEWRVGSTRFFGAKVGSNESARALEKLVRKELKGSSPQSVCHDPKPTRTLAIDLATGELKKLSRAPLHARAAHSTVNVTFAGKPPGEGSFSLAAASARQSAAAEEPSPGVVAPAAMTCPPSST